MTHHSSLASPSLRSATLGAVALISATGLVWEIVLTRLASVLLSYHYVFVAVSLAVFGLGLGAALVYALPELRARRMAAPGALVTAIAFPGVALLAPWVAARGSLAALVVVALVPFLAQGVAMAAVFRAYSLTAPSLYGADLAGAGVGAVAAVLGMDAVGPFGLLFALGVTAALAGLLLAWPVRTAMAGGGAPEVTMRPRELVSRFRGTGSPAERSHARPAGSRPWLSILGAALLVVNAAGLSVQAAAAPLGINYAALRNAPPDKTIVSVLNDPSQHARILDTRWDAFARTDVVRTDDPSRRLVFTDGGAGTYMLAWNGNVHSPQAQALRDDLETLPMLLGPHANVLVIGAGGGIDVVRALAAGASHVTAVELNAATVAAVRAERSYNGDVLDRPDVTTVVDDGRHFLARSHQRFDTILLNLVYSGAAEGTSHALAESYIFTTAAFQSYLAHLTPRGRIGIISHQALEGLRAFTTGVEALHQRHYSYADALLRSALLMTDNQTPETRPTLTLVQQAPFNQRELNLLHTRALGDLNLRPLYVPDLFMGSFRDMAEGQQTLDQFLQGSDYAVDPTSDDRPFFFNLNLGLPDGLGETLWYCALVIAGVLSLVLLLRSPAESPADGSPGKAPRGAIWLLGLYVALLGFGFMCVEVAVIQRFILVLGQPVLALTVVLTSLLVAGGAGSLLAGRLLRSGPALALAPLCAAVVVMLARLLLPTVATALLPVGLSGAVAGSVLTLLPLGLAMGMPFALGLRLAGQILPGDVALVWSINALFSVLGSVVAAVIALQYGFSTVLLAGAACYVVATAAFYSLGCRSTAPARSGDVASGRTAATSPVQAVLGRALAVVRVDNAAGTWREG